MITSVCWILDKNIIMSIHARQIAEHGGEEGIRDQGLLDSALLRAENIYHYQENTSIFDLSAGYAYGLIKNHPFVDGNKRVAYVASLVFLEANGFEIIADNIEKYNMFLGLASGNVSEKEMSQWLSRFAVPLKPYHALTDSGSCAMV